MKEFLELYSPFIAVVSLFSAPIAYIFGGKRAQKQALIKEVAVIKQTDADANKAIAELYKVFMEDHTRHLESLRFEIQELRTSNMAIAAKQSDILLLYSKEQRKSNELEKQNIELTRKSNELEQKNNDLTQKVEHLEGQIALLTAAKNKTK